MKVFLHGCSFSCIFCHSASGRTCLAAWASAKRQAVQRLPDVGGDEDGAHADGVRAVSACQIQTGVYGP